MLHGEPRGLPPRLWRQRPVLLLGPTSMAVCLPSACPSLATACLHAPFLAGALLVTTEFGRMAVAPGEICVVQVRRGGGWVSHVLPCFHALACFPRASRSRVEGLKCSGSPMPTCGKMPLPVPGRCCWLAPAHLRSGKTPGMPGLESANPGTLCAE